MKNLDEKFAEFCVRHQLIRSNDYILVAVSGGVDSVVLLQLLVSAATDLQLNLDVVHVNHMIRGKEADRDQAFVEDLSEKYHLQCFSRKLNVPKFVAQKGLSEEEGARILRFRFFDQVLAETGADSVALGHHADDQVETVLDHFLRGSGLRGLSGMAPKRDQFIRPLLFANRSEIETYATSNSLHYLIDSTNELPVYKRNRIRFDLIPYLKKEFNPGLEEVILRTAAIMGEVEDYVTQNAISAFETCLITQKKNKIILEIDAFLNYFIAIQKYIVYQVLEHFDIYRSHITSQMMDRILKLARQAKSGKRVNITSEIQALVDHGQFVFQRETIDRIEILVQPGIDYPLAFEDYIFRANVMKISDFTGFEPENRNIEFVDADKLKGRWIIRNFKEGDRFKPLNFSGEKKISNFFTDEKIPLHLRSEIPFLTCSTGIVWIMGFQIDDRFKITEKTKRVVKLQIKRKVLNG